MPSLSRTLTALAACAARARFTGPAALVVLAAAAPGAAQTLCETGLREAGQGYEVGLFAAVPGQLAPCFQRGTSRTEQRDAYALLARAYLAADELAKARQAVADLLHIDPLFEPVPPPRFAQLVARVRREEATVQVTSVSKTRESLSEAPATVVVVTAEEIERRGYLDLLQVLRDLPGFDVSVTGDVNRATVVMRGFHAGAGDRVQLLLDGVEQNDLSTNSLYLSRQYALTNVDRVEVVYGPASTMYGSNAYSGVVNVITKAPAALVAEDKRLGLIVQATGGGLHTRDADVTLAGKDRSGTISWSVASHLYHDDGTQELSRFASYRYDYSNVDYRARLGPSADVQRARQLDNQFLQQHSFHFSDPADDWSVYGKLRIANLILGVELWRTQEGLAALGSLGQDGQSSWAPRQALLYLKYRQPVGRDLTFNTFIRYQESALDHTGTKLFLLNTYANGGLGLADLAFHTEPTLQDLSLSELSTQIRGELNLVYQPSSKFSAVGGMELWKSSIQTAFGPNPLALNSVLATPLKVEHTDLAAFVQTSYKPLQTFKLVLAGRLNYNTIDNQPPPPPSIPPSKLLPRGIQTSKARGFGTLFSPRAAVIYTPARDFVLKAIYSQAFKDPPDAEKFSSILGAVILDGRVLAPEKVRNYELSAGWRPAETLSVQASVYRAEYTGQVGPGQLFAGCAAALMALNLPTILPVSLCTQYQNRDDFRIQGLAVDGRYRLGRTEISGNYTFTSPFQLNPQNADRTGPQLDDQGHPIRKLRVGDVASQHLNLGVNRDWLAGLNTDLRLRYVGPRPTGPKTTDGSNPLDRIAGYTEARATVSYTGILRGATLQLIVDNLFGRVYFDPGTQPLFVAAVPQPGRTFFLRIITGLGRPPRADAARAGGEAAQ